MVSDAWKRMWHAATEAKRWMLISEALDILSEAYEMHTAIPATAMLTSEGVCLQIEFEDGLVVEFLGPEDILDLSPQAYSMLRRAKAVEN